MQAAYQQDDIPVDDPALLAAAAVETPTPTPIPTPQAPRSGGSISRLNDISNNISSNITRNVTVNSASNRLIPHPESDTSPRAESPSVDPATPLTGDTAESPEEGETLAEGSSKPSPFIISLSQSPFWVPSDLHRRLSLGPVPRLNNSEAGTSSADIFTSRLLEDTFELHLKKGTVLRGFQGFLSAVVDEAAFSS